ncbi:peptide ABC transporter permease [Candidatus Methylacidiphilum fumarolicum]|uniref:ABC-type dipeptide/oligopeptide/nickel transport system, permease component (Modular protein) n=2 Tax=Candidatus Methylacidiphilum fumarolicum TaxID=591154 RepID=I0JYM0_METFB|nr:ABC transporter permease subunit [Candidatus Methylacidiphilum fumarolicum]TFE65950.1 peptide ABC transporter permease [Candidatus Methylacidiphilum fumarolicum]TFE77550.1 peptide ABC transporter permease [Candidatus Methylacidiphilum fumarolicum]CAI9085092.1 murein tripeptide ABC transporter/oligopeptide ABC transporter inner membrane subunit OppB [Candidatus Methylacidiphilum fumarolicum]CCG92339.1 ABC-type dipeptide/oligopeptide/nickel transport system, permease component (modular protein
MFIYFVRRILSSLFVLFGIISLTFFLVRLAPGNPFSAERNISPAILRNLEARYKLSGSLLEQYKNYLLNLCHGDLMLSTRYRNRSVNEIIGQTLPVSITLGGCSFALALAFGISSGCLSAFFWNKPFDKITQGITLMGISIPSFVLAPICVLVFAILLRLLPPAGWGSIEKIILPAFCLGIPYGCVVSRLTRSAMLEVLHSDYIRTAKAKGLTESSILFVHGLKAAASPIIAYSGPLAANLLTGSMVIEQIFGISGMGSFFVDGVLNRDVFLVSGVTLVYSLLLILFNLLADMLCLLFDKRIVLE